MSVTFAMDESVMVFHCSLRLCDGGGILRLPMVFRYAASPQSIR